MLAKQPDARNAKTTYANWNGVAQFRVRVSRFSGIGMDHFWPWQSEWQVLGWRTTILPYIEQNNVRQLYDISLNWWEGTNLAVASIPIPIMNCPSTPQVPLGHDRIAKPPRPSLTFATPLARTDYEAILEFNPLPSVHHSTTPEIDSPSCIEIPPMDLQRSPTEVHKPLWSSNAQEDQAFIEALVFESTSVTTKGLAGPIVKDRLAWMELAPMDRSKDAASTMAAATR